MLLGCVLIAAAAKTIAIHRYLGAGRATASLGLNRSHSIASPRLPRSHRRRNRPIDKG
jgi:hypothetical protein